VERYPNPSTVNLHLAALRGVLRACWRLGLMDGEEYHRAADVPSVRGSTLPKGRALGAGEIRALFDACASDPSPAGRRDAALLAVMYGAGLRRAEVATLQTGDMDAETGSLAVRGKGGKERLVYLANGAAAAMTDWLAVRGAEPGPLFLRIRKDGQISAKGLTAQAVYLALRKRAEQAGVERFSPHDLRRTFVGDLLDAGADVSMVQRLAGHAQVTTTVRYDRRPERAKQKAAGMLFVPYTPQASGG
jgi:site-specific recombinase XerD